MGCGEFLVKYILFFSNLFFALAGLALLGIGIAVQLKISVVVNNISDINVQVAPITTMVVGGIVFLIAFYGCCGAIRESNCMLVTYAIFMIVLMIVKIAFASIIFVKLDDIIADLPIKMNQFFNRDPVAFQEIERAFTCCGPAGPISYPNPINLPPTCCDTTPCLIGVNTYEGCNGKIINLFETYGLTIGIVPLVIASFELVAVVFSLCLANHARNKDRRSRY